MKRIRNEYTSKFPGDAPIIEAGVDRVPLDWINQRLAELGESWHVATGKTGYILPALVSKP